MSAESLWGTDVTKILMESSRIPEDVLDEVAPVERTAPTDKNQSMKNVGKHAPAGDSLPGPSKKCQFASPLTEKQVAEFCQPSIPKKHTKEHFMGSLRSGTIARPTDIKKKKRPLNRKFFPL